MNNVKRFLALFMAVVMCISLMPGSALAEDGVEAVEPEACEHVFKDTVTEPTCTEQGFTTHTCTLCGYNYADSYTEPDGHSPEYAAAIPATASQPGRTEGKTCSRCGKVLEGCSELPPLGETADPDAEDTSFNEELEAALDGPDDSGQCGDNLTWAISGSTLTISGSGPMWDYGSNSGVNTSPWYSNKYAIQSIVIEQGVTSIGTYAFFELSVVESISIPESVTSVGSNAFQYFSSYPEVIYGGTLKMWQNSITFAEGSNSHPPAGAEIHCDIDRGAFGMGFTWKLSEGKALTVTGTGDMPDFTVESPAPWHEYKEDIVTLSLSEGITGIGSCAFYECSAFASVTIPNSVTKIGTSAFQGCTYLYGLNIGNGLTSISVFAFFDCSNLQTVTVAAGNTVFSSSGNCLIKSDKLVLGTTESVIPSGVTAIGSYAFSGRSALTQITVPDTVTAIEDYAFYGCSGLSSVTIPGTVSTVDEHAFSNCEALASLTIGEGVTSIGDYAFSGCTSLQSVTVPGSMTAIGKGLFNACSAMSSVTVKEGVESIGQSAFGWCTALTAVTLPTSLESIGEDAFIECAVLGDVYYSGMAEDWNDISVGSGNAKLTGADIHYALGKGTCGTGLKWVLDSAGVLSITGTGPMASGWTSSNVPWNEYREQISAVNISSGVTSIGAWAFYRCGITSLNIPSSVETIEPWAFYDCDALVSLNIPDSVVSIDAYAFRGCDGLKTLNIGSGLATLGEQAFIECSALESITVNSNNSVFKSSVNCVIVKASNTLVLGCKNSTIPSGVTTIGDNAFDGCTGLESIVIPSGVTVISKGAFEDCGLTGCLELPEGLTTVGASAFFNCKSLTSVKLPVSVTSIGNDAFYYCNSLTDVYYSGTQAQWAALQSDIGVNNEKLTGATVHCDIDGGSCGETAQWRLTEDYTLRITGSGAMTDYPAYNIVPWVSYTSNIKAVEIGSGITSIGKYAFYGLTNSNISTVTIPDSVLTIGEYSFMASAVTGVTMGAGVTAIKSGAFQNCSRLAAVNIPDSVTTIGDEVFSQCSALKTVSIGAGVSTIGSCAFWLSPIENLTLSASNATFRCESSCIIRKSDDELVFGLSSSAIPKSVKSFSANAFRSCTGLTSAVIPEGVKALSINCFNGCTGLTEITLPHSIKNLYRDCLKGCTALSDIYYMGTSEDWALVSKDSSLSSILSGVTVHCCFGSGTCGDNLEWVVTDDNVLKITGTGTMYNYSDSDHAPWFELRTEIHEISIASGVESIGDDAFSSLWEVRELIVPSGVKTIGDSAFRNSYFQNVVLPDSVTDIGDDLFYHCINLKSVTLGSGITVISNWCFTECTRLDTVIIRGKITGIGISAFYRTAINDPVLPQSMKYFSTGAFGYCPNLTCITLPGGISELAIDTFEGSARLSDIYFCGTEEKWNSLTAGKTLVGPENVTVHFMDEFCSATVSAEYLLMRPGETAQLSVTTSPAALAADVSWSSENHSVADVDSNGLVTAGSTPGTTYIKASVPCGGRSFELRCRIDVTEAPAADPASRNVTAVSLVTTAATANVYRTEDLAQISILPLLEQNISELVPGLAPEDGSGVSVKSARFASDAAAEYFDLRVRDDRTLEIVPTGKAVADAASGSKNLKGSYSSAVLVSIDGRATPFTTETFKLTVKKTLPSVKIDTVTINSFIRSRVYPLSITGGTALSVEPDTAAAAKAKTSAIPEWMVLDGEKKTVTLSYEHVPEVYPGSGKLFLKVNLKGWALPVSVKAAFKMKLEVPKLSFSAKSMTLLQGTADYAYLYVKVSPTVFHDYVNYPMNTQKVERLEGKEYKNIGFTSDILFQRAGTDENGYRFKIGAPNVSEDGKPHTYRLTLRIADLDYYYTVKTVAASTKPEVTAKTAGSINTMIPDSPTTVTLTPKNFHSGIGEKYTVERIEMYKGSKLADYDVSALFKVTKNGGILAFTEKTMGTLVKGYTYKAVIGCDINGDDVTDITVTVPLKVTFASSAPSASVTVKKTGALDITRRGNTVTLTSTVKNLYRDINWSLVVYQKTGKTTVEVPAGSSPFRISPNNGVFTLKLSDGWTSATKDYSVAVKVTSDGIEYLSKAIAIPVTAGKVSVKGSVSAVTLYKQDRFSRGVFSLNVADSKVASISNVTLDPASAGKYSIVKLGGNSWGIEYLGHTLPASFKAGTVQLSVFVQGCDTSVATVKLKVNFK